MLAAAPPAWRLPLRAPRLELLHHGTQHTHNPIGAGTGKTAVMRSKLGGLDADAYQSYTINLNSKQ